MTERQREGREKVRDILIERERNGEKRCSSGRRETLRRLPEFLCPVKAVERRS